ncbi:Uncharacterised protein [Lysinibacillus capsici]|uniref:Uncharacterized protein n=1 Tax=Lysinibacillus capsici TaxID=2115968 RepID=A0A2X0XNJ0_9BACI|nr:hypothetical protein BFZC1_11457 [Lysinibacillus fusiformis ZC1]EKU43525.1 hypothetical protein C518_1407 [Lysinibacillus fusiformis ZB2]SPU00724.1 Uncharacterised protein [Lysinibacillus capsici]
MSFVPLNAMGILREKDEDHWDIDRWENDGGRSLEA